MADKTRKEKQPQRDAQSKLFVEMARKLGCDEEADTDEVMRRLVAQKRREPKDKIAKPKTKKAAK